MMPNETDDNAKRRKLDGTGNVPTRVPLCLYTCLTDFCLALTSDVRNWLAEIGLSQYADYLIAKGYDDLQDLQEEVNLKDLKTALRKDNTMLTPHLDKLIRKLERDRVPIDDIASFLESASKLPSSTSVAASSSPVATLPVQPVATSSSAATTLPVQPKQIYPVDYSQVSARVCA